MNFLVLTIIGFCLTFNFWIPLNPFNSAIQPKTLHKTVMTSSLFPGLIQKKRNDRSQDKARTILIEIVPEQMKFDTDSFTVIAGEKIILELDNLDGMQHNLLILKPGSLEIVGAAADAMLRDPKASEKHYVPEVPEVLYATEMLNPQELYTLSFIVPKTPGYYPFVCTFPGHWRMMNGIMKVVNSN